MERHIAAGVLAAALLAALLAAAISAWPGGRQTRSAADANAVSDALVSALAGGAAPQTLLDAFAAAGSIRAATIYDANGAAVAKSGTPSPDAEQIFRSLPGGGSLSIEPGVLTGGSTPMRELLRTAAISAACAAAVALAAAALVNAALRRRVDAMRAGVDEAFRDQTYATRLGGIL